MTRDKFENLLVDLCFADWEELPKRLQSLGLSTNCIEDSNTIIIDSAIRCGFSKFEDPQGRAIQISMALAGLRASLWFPNLLKKYVAFSVRRFLPKSRLVDCRRAELLKNAR